MTVTVIKTAATEILRTIAGSIMGIYYEYYSYTILQKIKKCFGN